MTKSEATVEELVGMIERDAICNIRDHADVIKRYQHGSVTIDRAPYPSDVIDQ